MRKFLCIPAFLAAGLAACNDSGSKTEEPQTAVHAAAMGDSMHHTMDSTQMAMEMPAIPEGAKVFFVNLKDGETVHSPFKVEMGVEGIGLDSAGIIRQASGHHHILIDAGTSLNAGTVVPKDATHIHFGNAQTATELTLTPGKHTLTLQYADGIHRSYGEKLAASITVNVE